MKIIFPSISVVIATFNSERTLDLCLEKLNVQEYDKKKMEIIVVDGGSKDSTLKIAKSYGAKVIRVDPKKQNAEYNKGIGLKYAKGEIVLFLDHDNIIPHTIWLKNIVQPFLEDKDIVGSEPLRFHYDPKMTPLDRYFALFGGSDPVVYYLGKNSHLPWSSEKYNLLGKAVDKGKYYKIIFSRNALPALGGNGAAIKRKLLLTHAESDPDHFIHTDVVADLVGKGFNNYAIIKESIIHLTNNKTIPFLQRRVYFMEKYQLSVLKQRRYKVYDPERDKLKLLLFIVFALTFIIPFLGSIRGYLKVRDMAWFLHPFMCFAFLIIYSIPVFRGGVKNVILGK